MKKTKKFMSVLLVVVMICSMLSGCDAKKETEETTVVDADKETTSTETSNETASGERMTISVMGIDWGYGPLQNSVMEQWWEDYYDVDFDVEWVSYTDYDQKLNTLLSSGKQDDIPDVVQIKQVNSSFYYPVFTQAIEAGGFVDMSKYLYEGGVIENNKIMSTWSDTY